MGNLDNGRSRNVVLQDAFRWRRSAGKSELLDCVQDETESYNHTSRLG